MADAARKATITDICPGVWGVTASRVAMGMKIPLRAVIAALPEDKLWVHSPVALTPALESAVRELGEVSYLVAPNNAHHLYLPAWREAFPDAAVFLSRALPAKHPEITAYTELTQDTATTWAPQIEGILLDGAPTFDETIFYHQPSRSLIVTDFIQHHPPESQPKGWQGWMLKTIGFSGICTAPPLKTSLVLKNKSAFGECLQKAQKWPIARIIPAHGPVITDDAQPTFHQLSAKFLV